MCFENTSVKCVFESVDFNARLFVLVYPLLVKTGLMVVAPEKSALVIQAVDALTKLLWRLTQPIVP
jgi:hypothetical protein